MQPPFYPGEPTQGYQGRLKNHEIFDLGVQGLQDASMQKYNKKFNELGPEEQDAVLTSFEKGEIRVKGIDSAHFFALLRDLTIQGVYADPMYGGNKNMEGWKMKNYPGNQGSYTDIIDKDEFAKIDPKSLKDHLS
jgi:gluconate 2-dehydrogenase gamma chain